MSPEELKRLPKKTQAYIENQKRVIADQTTIINDLMDRLSGVVHEGARVRVTDGTLNPTEYSLPQNAHLIVNLGPDFEQRAFRDEVRIRLLPDGHTLEIMGEGHIVAHNPSGNVVQVKNLEWWKL